MTRIEKENTLIAELEAIECTGDARCIRNLMAGYHKIRVNILTAYPHMSDERLAELAGEVMNHSLGLTPAVIAAKRDELALVARADAETRYSIPTE